MIFWQIFSLKGGEENSEGQCLILCTINLINDSIVGRANHFPVAQPSPILNQYGYPAVNTLSQDNPGHTDVSLGIIRSTGGRRDSREGMCEL